jgi:hypothetical protein
MQDNSMDRLSVNLPSYQLFTKEMNALEAEIWLNGLLVLKRTHNLRRKLLLKVAQNSFADPLTTWPFQYPRNKNWQQFSKEFKRCFINRASLSQSIPNEPTSVSRNPTHQAFSCSAKEDQTIDSALQTEVGPASCAPPMQASSIHRRDQLSNLPQVAAATGDSQDACPFERSVPMLREQILNQQLNIKCKTSNRMCVESSTQTNIIGPIQTHDAGTQVDFASCPTRNASTQSDSFTVPNVIKPRGYWPIEIDRFDCLNGLVLITRETNTVLNLGGHF